MNFFIFVLLLKFYFVNCHYNINDDVLFGITWKTEDKLLKENVKEVTLVSKDKEFFRCVIPSNIKDKFDRSSDSSYNGPSEDDLLKPLFSAKVCTIKVESYWSYEICHGRNVRQYHEEPGQEPSMQEYSLGKFQYVNLYTDRKSQRHSTDDNSYKDLPTVTINSVNFPYYPVNMTGGTKCDLIGQTRSINVLYICQSGGRGEIYQIHEVRTCQYQAIVFTKLLCEHPGYTVTDNRVNDISCYSLNGAKERPKSFEMLQNEIDADLHSVSTLFEHLNADTHIKVEAYKENGKIKYQIKIVGKDSEEKDENSDDNIEKLEKSLDDESTIEKSPLIDDKSPKSEDSSTKRVPSFYSSSGILNRFMAGKFCVDGGEGWWRHRVCYNKKISQYHLEIQMETSEIMLGLWKEDKHKEWLTRNPEKRPTMPAEDRMEIYQYYSEGHVCDETKAKRDTVLRIRCGKGNSSAISISFLEPKTCSYLVTIESSMFCSMIKKADEFGLVKSTDY